MLIAVLALLFWLVWLSLDPDWQPAQHRFRLHEPSYVHLLERFFEMLPPWARAAIVALVPAYVCWLFGSGVVSGLTRIFNREPIAALDEDGIRCWSAFGPCKIAWSEVTRISVMRARRLGPATHTTIRIDRTYNTFRLRRTLASILLTSNLMVFDTFDVMAFLRRKRPDLCEAIE